MLSPYTAVGVVLIVATTVTLFVSVKAAALAYLGVVFGLILIVYGETTHKRRGRRRR